MAFDMKLLAYCGLYCDLCPVRVAHREGDERHLEGIPARYKRENMIEQDCEGCKGRNLCGPCRIKDCAAPRGLDSCADCPEFPCPFLLEFESDGCAHHHQAVANLREIRELVRDPATAVTLSLRRPPIMVFHLPQASGITMEHA
jgi:hypothetical protein